MKNITNTGKKTVILKTFILNTIKNNVWNTVWDNIMNNVFNDVWDIVLNNVENIFHNKQVPTYIQSSALTSLKDSYT